MTKKLQRKTRRGWVVVGLALLGLGTVVANSTGEQDSSITTGGVAEIGKTTSSSKFDEPADAKNKDSKVSTGDGVNGKKEVKETDIKPVDTTKKSDDKSNTTKPATTTGGDLQTVPTTDGDNNRTASIQDPSTNQQSAAMPAAKQETPAQTSADKATPAKPTVSAVIPNVDTPAAPGSNGANQAPTTSTNVTTTKPSTGTVTTPADKPVTAPVNGNTTTPVNGGTTTNPTTGNTSTDTVAPKVEDVTKPVTNPVTGGVITPGVLTPVSEPKPVSTEEVTPTEKPEDEVIGGGEAKPIGEEVVSETEVPANVTVPSDEPQQTIPAGTTVVRGNVVVTKEAVAAIPGREAIPAVLDENGEVITPEQPAVPEVPGQEAETQRVDTHTTVTTIKHGTIYVIDNTLAPGEIKVLTEGADGSVTNTVNVTYINDVEASRADAGEQRIDAVNKVVAYGPGVKTEQIVVKEFEVPFNTIRRANPELKEGEERVVTKGQVGLEVRKVNRIIYTEGANISSEVDEHISTEMVREAVDEVVEYGTKKDVVEVYELDLVELTPPKITVVENPNLPSGEAIHHGEAIYGKREQTVRITNVNGVEVKREVLKETITEAQDLVIEMGTKVETHSSYEERKTETIEFKTIERENPDLPKGERRVVTPGQNGSVDIVTVVTLEGDQEVGRGTYEDNRIPAIDEVVEIGTKEDEVNTEATRETKVIDYKTIERPSSDLYEGERRVVTPGKNGSVDIVTYVTTTNGVETDRRTAEENRVNAVDEVVEVGTKPRVQVSVNEVREDIDFTSETREAADLKKGETRIAVKGQKGYRITKVTTTNIAGQVITNSEVIKEVAPINEVIEVGTKEDIRYDMRVEREDLDYKTVTRESKDLFAGESRVVSQGEKGRKTTTYKDIYIDGIKVGTEKVGEHVVEPKDRIVEIGTKEEWTTTSVTNTEVINFSTETVKDPNLEEGVTQIRTVGKNGSRVIRITTRTNNRTGETTTRREVVSESAAVAEVVAIGTKPKAKPVETPAPTPEVPNTVNLEQFVAMSEAEQDAYIAAGKSIDSTAYSGRTKTELMEDIINMDRLNQEFGKILNAERAKAGLSQLTYAGQSSELYKSVDIRANEMADHGSLRYQGVKTGAHKRPDGSDWTTADSPELKARLSWHGENTLQLGSAGTPRRMADEAALAKTLYKVWYDSPSHKALMFTNKVDAEYALSVGIGARNYGSTQDDHGLLVGVFQVATYLP